MVAFIFTIFLFFAETSSGGDGKSSDWFNSFTNFYNTWLNYPGFEAWRFLNFGVFVALLVYFLRKPVSNAFKARRESIRQELVKARQERDAAAVRLAEVEAKISGLDREIAEIKSNSKREAEAETARIEAQTEAEIGKLREQANREIASATQSAKQELRKYSAEESIKLAEKLIRENLTKTDAENLVAASINGLGGAK